MEKGYIEIDRELCKGCGVCMFFCPKHLIAPAAKLNAAGYMPAKFENKEEACTGCAICAMVCPEVAIEVYRG